MALLYIIYIIIGLIVYTVTRDYTIKNLLKQCEDLELKDKKIYVKNNINAYYITIYSVLWPILVPSVILIRWFRYNVDDAIDKINY